MPADGLHVVRTYTDSKFRNATTKWVGSEAVTAEITNRCATKSPLTQYFGLSEMLFWR